MKRIISLVIIFAATVVFAADVLYVQSLKAKVMASPGFKSDVKAVVERGTELAVTGKEGDWFHVTTPSGNEGWVNRLTVSENPPLGTVKPVEKETAAVEDQSRRRASAMTSAAAARGLAEKDRKRLSQLGLADYDSLKSLEGFSGTITGDDVEKFVNTGE